MESSSSVKTTTLINTLIDILNADEIEVQEHRKKAEEVTHLNFGRKRALFNPIYVSNICLADCSYCGYRISNKKLRRKTLNEVQSVQEALFLEKRGVKNLLILAGDYRHDKYLEMLLANIKSIKTKTSPDWLGIEVATL